MMLINVKRQSIIDILTFISMINTIFENLEVRKSLFFSILDFKSSLNFMKKVFLPWGLVYKNFIL